MLNSNKIMFGGLLAMTLTPSLAEKKPNLVYVFADQWRRQSLGFRGDDPVLTPNIDKFASWAFSFDNATAAVPISGPNRACLMTGKYPINHGVYANSVLLNPDEPSSMGKIFKAAGYKTAYIGKWHLNGIDDYAPVGERRHGFDFWMQSVGHQPFSQTYYIGSNPNKTIIRGRWTPTLETEEAIRFIEENKNDPFCVVLSWAPPHTSGGLGFEDRWQPGKRTNGEIKYGYGYGGPPEYEALYSSVNYRENPIRGNQMPIRGTNDNANDVVFGYFGAITALDNDFGLLMDYLESSGLIDNTIVVFTSDHGESMGSQGLMTKGTWFEESVGVPCIIGWKGKVVNKRETCVFNSIDLLPTLLNLMEVENQSDVDGINYSPMLLGESFNTPEYAFLSFDTGGEDGRPRYWRALYSERYTYVLCGVNKNRSFTQNGIVLYDRLLDPLQLSPIFKGMGQDSLMNALHDILVNHLDSLNDDFIQNYWHGEGENVVYVDPNHPNASDSNPGNDPEAPWKTLNCINQDNWRDGYTIRLAPGVHYYDGAMNNQLAFAGNKTIVVEGWGESPEDCIIKGMTDEEFEEGEKYCSRFMNLNNGKMTIRNLTLMNARHNTNLNGSLIRVNTANATMILEDVIFKNTFGGGVNSNGGAVSNAGVLHCMNVVFYNCKANGHGGALHLTGKEQILKNCYFLNNVSNKTGGAVHFNTSTVSTSNVKIEFLNSYFEQNLSLNNSGGGTVNILNSEADNKTDILFQNCTFFDNVVNGGSAAMNINTTAGNTPELNFVFANNTLFKNKVLNRNNVNAGGTLNIAGQSALLTGNCFIINNTFLENNNPMNGVFDTHSVVLNDQKVNMVVSNNLFFDHPQGVSFAYNINSGYNSQTSLLHISNNLFDSIGGDLGRLGSPAKVLMDYHNENYRYNLSDVNIHNELSFCDESGQYFLDLMSDSPAIDRGTNSVYVNGVNVIPQKDVCNNPILNNRDIGAYETIFTSSTSNLINAIKVKSRFPTFFDEIIHLIPETEFAQLFNISGENIIKVYHQQIMNTQVVPSGLYILQTKLNTGLVFTTKMIKL